MLPKELNRLVLAEFRERLTPLGFVVKRGYPLRRRTPAVTDCLTPQTSAVRHGPLTVGVYVGVHCAPLQQLVSELTGRPYAETTQSFCTSIGYLETEPRWHVWSFDRDAPDLKQVGEIAQTLIRFGLPFLASFTDLASVRDGCRRHGLHHNNQLLLPALEYLMGDYDNARRMLTTTLASVGDMPGPWAEEFRSAAARLLERCDR